MKKLFAIAFATAITVHLATAQTGNDKATTPSAKSKPTPTQALEKNPTKQDKVTLNPQPLPPRVAPKTVNPSDKVALNPQPLPPKPQPNTAEKKKTTSEPK